MDTVSVVIPTWNRGSLLRDAVLSALNQSIPPLEVLVCDDGSTDDSEGVIAALGDPKVRWLPGVASGRPAVPRNRGIQASKGKWIAFLDSDDVWLPHKLQMQIEGIRRTGLIASCTDVEVVRRDGSVSRSIRTRDHRPMTLPKLARGNRIVTSSVLVLRTLLENVGGFPEQQELRAAEDYALWLRVAFHSSFDRVHEPLVRYLDHPQNSNVRDGRDVWTKNISVIEDTLEWAQSGNANGEYSAILKRAARHARVRKALLPIERLWRRWL